MPQVTALGSMQSTISFRCTALQVDAYSHYNQVPAFKQELLLSLCILLVFKKEVA